MARKRKAAQAYDVVLEPCEEGGYTAYVPALRGCVSEGESEEEALENVKDAILTWLDTWQQVIAENRGILRRVEITR